MDNPSSGEPYGDEYGDKLSKSENTGKKYILKELKL